MSLTVPTYIRSIDQDKYLEVSKERGAWTEFIHNALNEKQPVYSQGLPKQDKPLQSTFKTNFKKGKK
jgi:hypothetical protein